MKTSILTLLLISIVSCKKEAVSMVSSTAPANFIDQDYSFFSKSKFHYYKDLNTIFINAAKSKGKGC